MKMNMQYKFVIGYTPTDTAGVSSQRVCSPLYGDDLSVVEEMESGEWYRKRSLDGRLTFVREDYEWIMGCAFDGTFKLTVQSSTDGGVNWYPYFEGTFSRANLEIDDDNKNVVLNGLNEGGEYNVIENGKDEEYDLMKIIPDSEAKEVQGEVHPALALVDYNTTNIEHSDIFCGAAITAGGYKKESGWTNVVNVQSDSSWNFLGVYAEAKVTIADGQSEELKGLYSGELQYGLITEAGMTITSIKGNYIHSYLANENDCRITFQVGLVYPSNYIYVNMRVWDSDGYYVTGAMANIKENTTGYYSPGSMVFTDFGPNPILEKVEIIFHYIRATLLTQDGGNADNVLDTGDYYKRMAAFNQDGGLVIAASANTVEQPNGHRLVPGTGEQGTVPQYFAPPDETGHWIPLAEDSWQYASMWYTIEPSVENGLLDRTKVGTFRWTRCWTLGTILDRLLKKISNNKVSFDQSTAGSEFLYATVNPLTQGEPFEYLYTQKSNVMRPSNGGESAARCPVRLDWFLDFLKNALNCYWWLKENNDGTYAFRVEHVEWFRRGGSYDGQLDGQIDLTAIKTRRNFVRNGEAAKRLDDQLHKYSYDMNGMTEKYLFSWQGDGGSDAFKGNPMFFKAGWVEKGSSESHEVDNIFADLGWLMLNAGTDTASSKNYDGVFVFSGYRADGMLSWRENARPIRRYPRLSSGSHIVAFYDIWLTVPEGDVINVMLRDNDTMYAQSVANITGTGRPQVLRLMVDEMPIGGSWVLFVDFGADWQQVVIHRIHALTGNVYNVPNTADRLNPDNYLQNGPLAWPWLQCEFLHYDIPAQRWGYKYDDLDDLDSHEDGWETDGTVKLRKMQDVPLLPLPTRNDERALEQGVKGGLRDSQGQLQTGIVKSATINLGTRNAELTLMYDMIG